MLGKDVDLALCSVENQESCMRTNSTRVRAACAPLSSTETISAPWTSAAKKKLAAHSTLQWHNQGAQATSAPEEWVSLGVLEDHPRYQAILEHFPLGRIAWKSERCAGLLRVEPITGMVLQSLLNGINMFRRGHVAETTLPTADLEDGSGQAATLAMLYLLVHQLRKLRRGLQVHACPAHDPCLRTSDAGLGDLQVNLAFCILHLLLERAEDVNAALHPAVGRRVP
mmetsp:Transcript_166522/g.529045  ORF Transcript_166522/g.529045 Transcript_166522/m.529045 type:complete len:226 (+) Transcript_166522:482-1159(+)